MRRRSKVLISGAGIAGPSLALWLERYGFDVTVVEKAPSVRRGGQAVDFKGVTHRTVLDRMGILDDVRRARSVGGNQGAIIDAAGRHVGIIPAEFSSGEIEIARGELARILVDRSSATCEWLFGDSIVSLRVTTDRVDLTFQQSPPRRFDLVVGADGIHSNVRKLVLGPESNDVSHLGYYYALADVGGQADSDNLMYSEPGRTAVTGAPKAPALFVFASDPLIYDRDDVDQQKQVLIEAYSGGAWRLPDLMAQIQGRVSSTCIRLAELQLNITQRVA